MSKKFKDVYDEISNSSTVSKSGRTIKSFSRSAYEDMTKALINDPDYEAEYVVVKQGKPVTEKVKIVEKFRQGIIKDVVKATGIDKAECDTLVNSHTFRNTDGFYEVATESIYKYMEAGKKFSFPNRYDFNASIDMVTIPEANKEYTDIKTKEKKFSHNDEHKRLVRTSKCPPWMKSNKGSK